MNPDHRRGLRQDGVNAGVISHACNTVVIHLDAIAVLNLIDTLETKGGGKYIIPIDQLPQHFRHNLNVSLRTRIVASGPFTACPIVLGSVKIS